MKSIAKIFFISFFLLATPFFTATVFAGTIQVRGFYLNNANNQTRIVMDLSRSTQYRTFMLQNPYRFVIDLKNVGTDQPLNLGPLIGTPIANYKYASHRNGIFRIVFGLRSPISPKIKISKNNFLDAVKLQIIFPSPAAPLNAHNRYSLNQIPQPQRIMQAHAVHPHRTMHPVISQQPHTVMSDNSYDSSSAHHRDIIVVVDPGHGGKDPGATGPGGAHEKTIVLAISKKLQRWINQQPGFHAKLTRTGDYYLTLRQRLAIARKDHADMFIAIHADTWKNTTAGGVSVFALSQKGATSEAARWLAARENASELVGGVNLQDKSHLLKSVLINLSQAATIRSSLEIGEDVIQSVRPIARLHHDIVEQAAFVVLKSPDIPSLLVETGFLSNPREEHRLCSQSYQNKLAEAIMQGILQYFSHNPPRGTWLSYWRKHPRA